MGKKEEMSRIRSLVDAGYACDPRISRLKEEEKQRKLDMKKAKQEAARARQEEEERKRREEEENKMKIKRQKEAQPSERYETPAELMGINVTPWTSDEQRLLEQALKTFPASLEDRWARISETIANRSKKDCMKRYKELVELVRAKKSAQAAVTTKK